MSVLGYFEIHQLGKKKKTPKTSVLFEMLSSTGPNHNSGSALSSRQLKYEAICV